MNNKNEINHSAIISLNANIACPVSIGRGAEVHGKSSLGKYSLLNCHSVLYADTKVGRYCSIARSCEIGADAHPLDFLSTSSFQYSSALMKGHEDTTFTRKVRFEYERNTTIGNDVWIGAKSVIKSGVSIGDGAIVAALSFVNKNVPPYAIVGGVPAKVIRYRFPKEIIAELLELRWWELSPKQMKNIDFDDVESAIKQVKLLKTKNEVFK